MTQDINPVRNSLLRSDLPILKTTYLFLKCQFPPDTFVIDLTGEQISVRKYCVTVPSPGGELKRRRDVRIE